MRVVKPVPGTYDIVNALRGDPAIAAWLYADNVSLRLQHLRELERCVNDARQRTFRSLPSLPSGTIYDMVLSNGKIVLVGGEVTDQGPSSVVNGIEEYPVRFSDGKHHVTFGADTLRAMLGGATYDAPKSAESAKNGTYTLRMNTRLPYSKSADWWVLDELPVAGAQRGLAGARLHVEGAGEWVHLAVVGDTLRCRVSPTQGGWKVESFEHRGTYEQPLTSSVVADRLGAMISALKSVNCDWSFKKRTEYWMYEYDTETGDTGSLLGRFPNKNLYSTARNAITDTGKSVIIKKVLLNGFTVKESVTEQVYRK